MKRIEEVNPIINCVVENRFEEALKEAKKVDHFIQESDKKFLSILEHEKPFFGVPFTIKELFSAKGTQNLLLHSSILLNCDILKECTGLLDWWHERTILALSIRM